ncbi:MAG: hypothetical protein AB7G75_21875 [Candidatus Binatia bacterium]
MEHQTRSAAQDPGHAAAATGGSLAPLVSPAAVPLGGRRQLRHPRGGTLCPPLPPSPHTGQPLLRHRQSLRAASGSQYPTQSRATAHQRAQATLAPPGGGTRQATATALVRRDHPTRGSRQPAGLLVGQVPRFL